MDKCREEFEAWIKSETGFDLYRTQFPMTKYEDQQYYDHKTNLAWLSWKASRESMKAIKLPNAIKADNRLLGDNEYCSGYNQALRDCEKQITPAGYKVE